MGAICPYLKQTMVIQYTRQQIDKALEKLPEELQEAIFSMETADAIWNACERQSIMDERMAKIAEYVGYVLMGLMPPQEFGQVLQKELNLTEKTAIEIGREINRFVFYPVRPLLEELYKVEITPSEKLSEGVQRVKEAEERPSGKEEPRETPGQDTYREPLE